MPESSAVFSDLSEPSAHDEVHLRHGHLGLPVRLALKRMIEHCDTHTPQAPFLSRGFAIDTAQDIGRQVKEFFGEVVNAAPLLDDITDEIATSALESGQRFQNVVLEYVADGRPHAHIDSAGFASSCKWYSPELPITDDMMTRKKELRPGWSAGVPAGNDIAKFLSLGTKRGFLLVVSALDANDMRATDLEIPAEFLMAFGNNAEIIASVKEAIANGGEALDALHELAAEIIELKAMAAQIEASPLDREDTALLIEEKTAALAERMAQPRIADIIPPVIAQKAQAVNENIRSVARIELKAAAIEAMVEAIATAPASRLAELPREADGTSPVLEAVRQIREVAAKNDISIRDVVAMAAPTPPVPANVMTLPMQAVTALGVLSATLPKVETTPSLREAVGTKTAQRIARITVMQQPARKAEVAPENLANTLRHLADRTKSSFVSLAAERIALIPATGEDAKPEIRAQTVRRTGEFMKQVAQTATAELPAPARAELKIAAAQLLSAARLTEKAAGITPPAPEKPVSAKPIPAVQKPAQAGIGLKPAANDAKQPEAKPANAKPAAATRPAATARPAGAPPVSMPEMAAMRPAVVMKAAQPVAAAAKVIGIAASTPAAVKGSAAPAAAVAAPTTQAIKAGKADVAGADTAIKPIAKTANVKADATATPAAPAAKTATVKKGDPEIATSAGTIAVKPSTGPHARNLDAPAPSPAANGPVRDTKAAKADIAEKQPVTRAAASKPETAASPGTKSGTQETPVIPKGKAEAAIPTTADKAGGKKTPADNVISAPANDKQPVAKAAAAPKGDAAAVTGAKPQPQAPAANPAPTKAGVVAPASDKEPATKAVSSKGEATVIDIKTKPQEAVVPVKGKVETAAAPAVEKPAPAKPASGAAIAQQAAKPSIAKTEAAAPDTGKAAPQPAPKAATGKPDTVVQNNPPLQDTGSVIKGKPESTAPVITKAGPAVASASGDTAGKPAITTKATAEATAPKPAAPHKGEAAVVAEAPVTQTRTKTEPAIAIQPKSAPAQPTSEPVNLPPASKATAGRPDVIVQDKAPVMAKAAPAANASGQEAKPAITAGEVKSPAKDRAEPASGMPERTKAPVNTTTEASAPKPATSPKGEAAVVAEPPVTQARIKTEPVITIQPKSAPAQTVSEPVTPQPALKIAAGKPDSIVQDKPSVQGVDAPGKGKPESTAPAMTGKAAPANVGAEVSAPKPVIATKSDATVVTDTPAIQPKGRAEAPTTVHDKTVSAVKQPSEPAAPQPPLKATTGKPDTIVQDNPAPQDASAASKTKPEAVAPVMERTAPAATISGETTKPAITATSEVKKDKAEPVANVPEKTKAPANPTVESPAPKPAAQPKSEAAIVAETTVAQPRTNPEAVIMAQPAKPAPAQPPLEPAAQQPAPKAAAAKPDAIVQDKPTAQDTGTVAKTKSETSAPLIERVAPTNVSAEVSAPKPVVQPKAAEAMPAHEKAAPATPRPTSGQETATAREATGAKATQDGQVLPPIVKTADTSRTETAIQQPVNLAHAEAPAPIKSKADQPAPIPQPEAKQPKGDAHQQTGEHGRNLPADNKPTATPQTASIKPEAAKPEMVVPNLTANTASAPPQVGTETAANKPAAATPVPVAVTPGKGAETISNDPAKPAANIVAERTVVQPAPAKHEDSAAQPATVAKPLVPNTENIAPATQQIAPAATPVATTTKPASLTPVPETQADPSSLRSIPAQPVITHETAVPPAPQKDVAVSLKTGGDIAAAPVVPTRTAPEAGAITDMRVSSEQGPKSPVTQPQPTAQPVVQPAALKDAPSGVAAVTAMPAQKTIALPENTPDERIAGRPASLFAQAGARDTTAPQPTTKPVQPESSVASFVSPVKTAEQNLPPTAPTQAPHAPVPAQENRPATPAHQETVHAQAVRPEAVRPETTSFARQPAPSPAPDLGLGAGETKAAGPKEITAPQSAPPESAPPAAAPARDIATQQPAVERETSLKTTFTSQAAPLPPAAQPATPQPTAPLPAAPLVVTEEKPFVPSQRAMPENTAHTPPPPATNETAAHGRPAIAPELCTPQFVPDAPSPQPTAPHVMPPQTAVAPPPASDPAPATRVPDVQPQPITRANDTLPAAPAQPENGGYKPTATEPSVARQHPPETGVVIQPAPVTAPTSAETVINNPPLYEAPKGPDAKSTAPEAAGCNHGSGCTCLSGKLDSAIKQAQEPVHHHDHQHAGSGPHVHAQPATQYEAPKGPNAKSTAPEAAGCNHGSGCTCLSGKLDSAIKQTQHNTPMSLTPANDYAPIKLGPEVSQEQQKLSRTCCELQGACGTAACPIEKMARNLNNMSGNVISRAEYEERKRTETAQPAYTSAKLSTIIPEAQKTITKGCCELQGACGTAACPIEKMAASMQAGAANVISRDEYKRNKTMQMNKKIA